MAIVPQKNLFSWENIESSSDLDRLDLVLRWIPDEELMKELERDRGKGRDDYPVRAVWNSILAGIVFQHPSVASLRRELCRNGELRELCGFDPVRGSRGVPPDWVYTRFLKSVFGHSAEIDKMFDRLVEELSVHLPGLGKNLAVDGKAISSAGKPSVKGADGRRETDGNWGAKTYRGEHKDGTVWEKVKWWFGFKLHLLVDADYELPLGFDITRASESDTERMLPLLERLKERHPEILETAEHLCGDKGYDSEENCRVLYDDYGIKPIIDIRHAWKDGENSRPLYPDRADNIVYDQDGSIFCVAQSRDDVRETEIREMAYCGLEKDRGTLKYRCPAAAYDLECPERADCGGSDYGRVVRVPMELDRRLFVPLPRESYKWERIHKKRTAVERVNSRLDVSFGFERHFIRGLKKMKLRVGLALIVMLSMALGSIKEGRKERMRSLVWKVKPPKAA